MPTILHSRAVGLILIPEPVCFGQKFITGIIFKKTMGEFAKDILSQYFPDNSVEGIVALHQIYDIKPINRPCQCNQFFGVTHGQCSWLFANDVLVGQQGTAGLIIMQAWRRGDIDQIDPIIGQECIEISMNPRAECLSHGNCRSGIDIRHRDNADTVN